MKMLSVAAAVLLLWVLIPPTLAADTNSISADLQSLTSRINEKLEQGKNTETDLAAELKEFDALLEKHKGGDAESLAEVLAREGGLYVQVLDEPDKAAAIFQRIKKDFSGTRTAARCDEILGAIGRQVAAKKIRDSLAAGTALPDFDEKDLAGNPLSVAKFRGKVVMLDFWATWCMPCRMELPNVIAAYQKHHAAGFEIIGISLDEDRAKMESFIKDQKMPWPQYFDGLRWNNKLVQKYGVNAIPATLLMDRDGKIIGKNLRGEALEKAVADALAK